MPDVVPPSTRSRDEWLDRIAAALAVPDPDADPDEPLLQPPSTAEALAALEASLGHTLPDDLRTLLARFGATSYVPGDVFVSALTSTDDEPGIDSYAAQLRDWGWKIPAELLVFGGEGVDALYGVWRSPDAPCWQPVVAVVVDGDLAVVGDNVASFIAGRMASHAILDAAEGDDRAAAILGALSVPDALRALPDDEQWEPTMAWSNPNRPYAEPDPFTNPIPLDELRAIAASHAHPN